MNIHAYPTVIVLKAINTVTESLIVKTQLMNITVQVSIRFRLLYWAIFTLFVVISLFFSLDLSLFLFELCLFRIRIFRVVIAFLYLLDFRHFRL